MDRRRGTSANSLQNSIQRDMHRVSELRSIVRDLEHSVANISLSLIFLLAVLEDDAEPRFFAELVQCNFRLQDVLNDWLQELRCLGGDLMLIEQCLNLLNIRTLPLTRRSNNNNAQNNNNNAQDFESDPPEENDNN